MRKIKIDLKSAGFLLVAIFVLLGGFYLKTNGKSFDKKFASCLGRGESKEICWKTLIEDEFNKKGLDASMELVAEIYAVDTSFGPSCHAYGHLLGKKAYELFKEKKEFKISSKTSFCSYGFFHGFMESLVSETNDFGLAREFCTYVDKQVTEASPDATLQCFHGIGHGWVNVHDRPELWGNQDKIVENALVLCEKVSANESQLSRCATGVFNGIGDLSGQGEYGLLPDVFDPLSFCRKQEERFKDPCYLSFNSALLNFAKGDFLNAAKYIESIPETTYAEHAILNLAAVYGARNVEVSDHSQNVLLCRKLPKRLINACLSGYAFSFLEHGEPGKEYLKAVSFCKEHFLTDAEAKACLSYIYGYFAQWYEEDKAYQICEEYSDRDFCKERVRESLRNLELNI